MCSIPLRVAIIHKAHTINSLLDFRDDREAKPIYDGPADTTSQGRAGSAELAS